MAQIRNKYDIKETIENEIMTANKSLPNFFNKRDELDPILGTALSCAAHIIFFILFVCLNFIMGIIMPYLPKPELPNRDIEFVLVQNESKPPINKNTKLRADRDSQAGGKHDPTKKISEPSPAPSKAVQKQPQKVASAPAKPIQQPQKPQPKPAVRQAVIPQAAPSKPQQPAKPSAVKAPAKPSVKPAGVQSPSAPKVATAPKSPFNIPVPKSAGNTGTGYKPAGSPVSGGNKPSSGTTGGQPLAPKFSSSTGSSGKSGAAGGTGSSGSKYASRGTGGYGTGGNPSPGNPNGTPGVDAIKQPDWGPYMRDLEQRIKRNWSPPKGDSSKRVVITFTIGRDGRLLSHRITKSSGVPLADRAAMGAIEATAPFRPLPPEFKGQSVPIEFTFDYNVINSVMK